jgi:hypothetical protein
MLRMVCSVVSRDAGEAGFADFEGVFLADLLGISSFLWTETARIPQLMGAMSTRV